MKVLKIILSFLVCISANSSAAQENLQFKYVKSLQEGTLCYDSVLHVYGLDSNFNHRKLIDTLKLFPVGTAVGHYKTDTNQIAFIKYGAISAIRLYRCCICSDSKINNGHIIIYATKKGHSTEYRYKNGRLSEKWVLRKDIDSNQQYMIESTQYDNKERIHGELRRNDDVAKRAIIETYRHGKLRKAKELVLNHP